MGVFEQILDLVRRPKRTGRPGVLGEGGYGSGIDPDNPNIMHLAGDGQNSFAPLIRQNPTTQTGPYVPPTDEPAPTFTPIDPLKRPTATVSQSEPELTPRVQPDAVGESQQIAPKDTFNRNSTLDLSRNAPRFEPVQLERMPIEARQAQARNTKPVYKDTGNPREDTARYEQDLRNWQNPIHHGNRFVAGLKTGGRAASEVARAGGGLPQIVGAFLSGNVYGDIQPNIVERNWRDDETAKAGQRRVAFDAIQTKDLQRRKLEGEVAKTNAETVDILDRPVRERIKDTATLAREERIRGEVERHNKAMEGLQGTSQGDSQKRAEETERHNKAMEGIGRLQVKATTLRGNEGRVTAQAWREYTAQKSQIDKDNQRAEKEYAEAQRAAEEFNKQHDELDKLRSAESTTLNPKDKEYYRSQADALQRRLATLGVSLRDRYGKSGYIRYSDEERWIAGDKPEAKDYPEPPELSFSEGPAVVDESDEGTSAPSKPTSLPRGRRRGRVAARVSKRELQDLTQ